MNHEMMTEAQALAYASEARGRKITLKTLTNNRKQFGAWRDDRTKEWFYPSKAVRAWYGRVKAETHGEAAKAVVEEARGDVDRYVSLAAAIEMLDMSGFKFEVKVSN